MRDASVWRPRPADRALVTAIAIVLLAAAPPVTAQPSLDCFECDFTIVTVEWNGTAGPGTTATGRFEVRNTGQTADSYQVTATAANSSWTVQTDPEDGVTAEVPPGEGLFAQEGNFAPFQVRVLVPREALAGATTTITITVQSRSDDALVKETRVESGARQTYGWNLDCTPFVTIQKSKAGTVGLNATNTGNGRDKASVTHTPVEGILPSPPKTFDARPGQTLAAPVPIGVGLRTDDGTYNIRWTLQTDLDPNAAACTTAVEVVGGDDGTGPRGDSEDSPGASTPLLLSAVLLLAALARTQRARR